MINLSKFPEFKKITIEDRSSYNEFYKQFEPYSDFDFNNLWVWFNEQGGLAMAEHNGNIVIRMDDPFKDGAKEYSVLGKTNVGLTMQRLLRWQKAMHLEPKIVMVPDEVVQAIANPALFTIEEDHDNSDYIYDVDVMYRAEGHCYAGYRRGLSQFRRQNPAIEVRDIDATQYDIQRQCINRLHVWESAYRQDRQSMIEGAALNHCLFNAEKLDVQAIGLFIDGTLESFVLYHIAPQGNYGMLNHIKCNNDYANISDFTMACFIEKMHKKGVLFENFEQDLGLSGLRTYKESLRPARYLKRFTLY